MEEKDIDIKYIRSEDNPSEIITKTTSEAYSARHMKSITERELWEIVDTGRGYVNTKGVMDDVITHEKTEYSSHSIAEVVDEINNNKHKIQDS